MMYKFIASPGEPEGMLEALGQVTDAPDTLDDELMSAPTRRKIERTGADVVARFIQKNRNEVLAASCSVN